jgi:hypothetical protein
MCCSWRFGDHHNLVAQAHQERQADRGHLEPSVKAVMFLRWIRRARAFTVLVCCLPLLSKADWLNSAVDALLLLFLSTELESRKWTIWRPNICFLFLRSAFRTSAFDRNPCFCIFLIIIYTHALLWFSNFEQWITPCCAFKSRTANNLEIWDPLSVSPKAIYLLSIKIFYLSLWISGSATFWLRKMTATCIQYDDSHPLNSWEWSWVTRITRC